MTGAERILRERQRQIEEEGYTQYKDDQHRDEQLLRAAACYIQASNPVFVRHTWPDPWQWNPSADQIRNLERAGALIAAEIDRIQRRREEE